MGISSLTVLEARRVTFSCGPDHRTMLLPEPLEEDAPLLLPASGAPRVPGLLSAAL